MARTKSWAPTIALVILVPTFLRGEESNAVVSARADAVTPRERLVSPRLAAALAASMPKYAPAKSVDKTPVLAQAGTSESIVLMSPVIVAETKTDRESRLLAEKLRDKKEAAALEAFNWQDGGTLLETGRAQVKLKYNAQHKGFDLLNLKF
jgi:hypothetical protein